MRSIISLTSVMVVFLTCSCAMSTASLQHYRGRRLAPAEESTLHFSDLVNITVDGVSLRHMKQLDKDVDWRRYNDDKYKTFSGEIKVQPGKHRIQIERPWRLEGGGMAWARCEGEFEPGKEHRVVMFVEDVCDYIASAGVRRRTFAIMCEIR